MIFKRLSDFYQSQLWRDFRKRIIFERTNKVDGIVYSEYSKKPIANGYDIVLHHIQPLTLQNVNDYSISLNPDNIQICTHKEHNEIHARFGYCTERKVYYVFGCPCSGKSTFVYNNMGNSDIVIDMDNIWQCITGRERYYKPQALTQNAFQLRNALLDMVKTRFPRQGWERAWIIEGGARKAERERRIKELGAEVIFIECDKETALQRLASDNERALYQKEWESYIHKWFDEYVE